MSIRALNTYNEVEGVDNAILKFLIIFGLSIFMKNKTEKKKKSAINCSTYS